MGIRRFDIEPLLPLLKSDFTLLAPNNRSVDGILREYASAVEQPNNPAAPGINSWQRPTVFAIDIYIQQLWQIAASQGISPFVTSRILSRFDEQEIWLQVVKSSLEKYPLLNCEDTAASVARSYRAFRQWDIASSNKIEQYRGALDFQTFLHWSQLFETRCKKLQAISLSDAGRIAAKHIEALEEILPKKIALINFNQPPPLYEELFASLDRVCELQWLRDNSESGSLSHLFGSGESFHRSFQAGSEEIEACIDWCQRKAELSPHSHIGIVVDNSHSLEPLIEEALFRKGGARNPDGFRVADELNRYHSSESLHDSPGFSTALSLLNLNRELIDSESFCKLLQSPRLIAYEGELQARLALEVALRREVEAQVRPSQLRSIMLQSKREHHCPALASALLTFDELARHEPAQQSLRQWLQLFSKQLKTLGWPGNSSSEYNQKLGLQWQQCMQRFASSSAALGNISLITALGKLHTFLRQSNINLNFDNRLQISLLDIEEALDLKFDHVWLLSADNRNWPQAANPVAFLPYGLQLEMKMPGSSSQQQLDLALTQLATLRKNTLCELIVSHHTLEDGLSIRPSALLRDIPLKELDAGDLCEQGNSTVFGSKNLERVSESLHIPLRSDEDVSGGTSLLSNQSNCPFRAFARNRLMATGLEDFSHGLNAIVRGNALHKALEHLSAQIGDSKKLASLSTKNIEELLLSSTTIAIEYLRRLRPETMTPAFSLLEKVRLAKLLEGFLTLERQRNEFKILHNERAVIWQHSRLSLSLRIDRIDRLSDGSLALIDYKTGKFTNYKWFDERPDDLQLPLYQIAVSNSGEDLVSATLIFQLNAENTGLISPMQIADFGAPVKVSGQAKSFEGGWEALQGYWNRSIHALVDEFESGLVAVAPTRKHLTCQYCDLAPLCRIAESNDGLAAMEEEL